MYKRKKADCRLEGGHGGESPYEDRVSFCSNRVRSIVYTNASGHTSNMNTSSEKSQSGVDPGLWRWGLWGSDDSCGGCTVDNGNLESTFVHSATRLVTYITLHSACSAYSSCIGYNRHLFSLTR